MHVLMDAQIKYLKQQELWPVEFEIKGDTFSEASRELKSSLAAAEDEGDEGSELSEEENLFQNSNKRVFVDSESEDEDSD
jgi:hypothetical protein